MSKPVRDPLTGAWEYSGSRARFPVNAGDIWACGDHLFTCGDLEEQHRVDEVLNRKPAPFMYLDPPWSASVAASYRTKAGVERRSVDFRALLARAFGYAQRHKMFGYVEMGKQGRKALYDAIGATNGTVLEEWPITYYRTKPCLIVAVSWGSRPESLPDLTGTDDENTPGIVMTYHRPPTVFDPMAGRGLTSRSAATCGIGSVNNELSPYRMAEAIESLVTLTGQPAAKIG